MIADSHAEDVPEGAPLPFNGHTAAGTPRKRLDAGVEVSVLQRLAEFLAVFLARKEALAGATSLEQLGVSLA